MISYVEALFAAWKLSWIIKSYLDYADWICVYQLSSPTVFVQLPLEHMEVPEFVALSHMRLDPSVCGIVSGANCK